MENSIKTQIELIHIGIRKAYEKYVETKTLGEKEIRGLRNSCNHPKITFYPDPSGNGDSCFSCDICGKCGKEGEKL